MILLLNDFGEYIVKVLGLLAQWLDKNIPLPWTLTILILAFVLLSVMTVVIWFLRGAVIPVRCKHPATTVRSGGDAACRRMVAGEWCYCFDHNGSKRTVNHKGKIVDPHQPRWKFINKDGNLVDRTDVGNNKSNGLLFSHGFARSPRNVFVDGFPMTARNVVLFSKNLVRWLKKEELVGAGDISDVEGYIPSDDERKQFRAVSARGERMEEALKILKFLLPATLLVVALTGFIHNMFLDYFALLVLWAAVEIFHKGLLAEPVEVDGSVRHWGVVAGLSASKKFGIMIGVFGAGFLIENYAIPFIQAFLKV